MEKKKDRKGGRDDDFEMRSAPFNPWRQGLQHIVSLGPHYHLDSNLRLFLVPKRYIPFARKIFPPRGHVHSGVGIPDLLEQATRSRRSEDREHDIVLYLEQTGRKTASDRL